MNPKVFPAFIIAIQAFVMFLAYAFVVFVRVRRQDYWNSLMDWEWKPLAKTGFYEWRLSKATKTFTKSQTFLALLVMIAAIFLLLALIGLVGGIYFNFQLPQN